MNRKQGLVLLVLAACAASYIALDLGRYLNLANLQAQYVLLQAWFTQYPLQTVAVYLAVYIVSTALSIPGATLLALLSGAIFGVVWGTVIVSVASTIGAILAMLAARTLLQDTMHKRFGAKLNELQAGLDKDGAFYLLSLRLLPIVPFFALNALMGLTRMKVWTYAWVSQLGMLPATVVYVNAGTQLASLTSVKQVASPAVLGSLAALAVLPWVLKACLNLVKKRRVYAQWAHLKPKRFDRNLVVIGAGAGGLVTAYIAAAVKAKVTLVEQHLMGGDCLNFGCVPSKALIKSANLAHDMRHAHQYGLTAADKPINFKAVMHRVMQVIKQIAPHDSVERYTELGVDVVQGHATIIHPWLVEIRLPDGTVQQLTTRTIVIAAGAAPRLPDLSGLDQVNYVTSDTLWHTFAQYDHAPKRLVVMGGGPIGCELAQAFARLGSQVTLVERGERLIPKEDIDVSKEALNTLQKEGITVLLSHAAVQCSQSAGQYTLEVIKQVTGSNPQPHPESNPQLLPQSKEPALQVPFDDLLIAVGRSPRLTGYGLEQLGLATDRSLTTNAYLQTLLPNIFAVGDVVGHYQFTHVAAHQAWYAAVNALFGRFKQFAVDYRVVPWVTFMDPEIARVGLSEQDAQAQGIAYEVTRYGLDDLDRAIADSQAHGFVKVLTKPGKDTILGVTIVGKHAAELLAEFVLGMKHGIGLNKILGTIHAYPTWSEANKYVAGQWRKAHQPKRILGLLEKFHAWGRG